MREMLPEVHQSGLTLERFAVDASSPVDRPQILAYALLSAWVAHWPSRASAEQRQLLVQTRAIREREPDRFHKQRRLALTRLAEQMEIYNALRQPPTLP